MNELLLIIIMIIVITVASIFLLKLLIKLCLNGIKYFIIKTIKEYEN